MKIALEVNNLSISFFNKNILDNLSLSFPKNSITVLVGRSGSGKTTFLRSLNRLNEEFEGCKMSGSVKLDLNGNLQSVFDSASNIFLDKQSLRRHIGMLFQTPQLLPISIYKNIALPLELVTHCPKKELQAKVQMALETVGLWQEVKNRVNLAADRLSGGQQQRLCLARTLALNPSVLLLDEPTASLDVHSAIEIENLLSKLKQDYSIIMVSHSLRQALKLADKLIVFAKGKIKNHFENPADCSEEDLKKLLYEENNLA